MTIDRIIDIFFYGAIISTVVFAIKTFTPIDFGTEVDGDFTSISGDNAFSIFTLESIAAFFMCSGWMGWLSLSHLHYSLKTSLIIALCFGIAGMFLFAWLIAQFKKLEHIPTANINELVGKIGKAYMTFAPKGNSKIQIEFNQKLSILEAINETDEEIKAFENIKVVKVENNQIYIAKGE